MLKAVDLHWAAGFLEGEGWFGGATSPLTITACQKQLEPLERLKRIFGGALYLKRGKHFDYALNDWRVSGPRAAGLMMTLWPLMSPRRRGQIEAALAGWKLRKIRRFWKRDS
jgi:hypothetical protein